MTKANRTPKLVGALAALRERLGAEEVALYEGERQRATGEHLARVRRPG